MGLLTFFFCLWDGWLSYSHIQNEGPQAGQRVERASSRTKGGESHRQDEGGYEIATCKTDGAAEGHQLEVVSFADFM